MYLHKEIELVAKGKIPMLSTTLFVLTTLFVNHGLARQNLEVGTVPSDDPRLVGSSEVFDRL